MSESENNLHNASEANTENTGEVKHETTLFAEPVGHFGGFEITNSLLNGWLSVVLLVVILVAAGKKVRLIPRGIQNVFELVLEKALELADSVTGSRAKSEKFLPLALSLFLFVLINNWLGLLPGVGTVGFIESHGHEKIFVPLLRGGTADINTTLALAIIAVAASHIFGTIAVGVWNYFNKFVNVKAFLEIPSHAKKDFSVILINPIKAFVGLIEIIGEVAKVASLSFRLFGNIFAGEVLLVSMMAIFAYLLPLPFLFLEIIVGLIQALIFAMLTLVYLTIATEEHDAH